MFNHLHYVPVLKWKLGEYQALSRLDPAVKKRVTPLIEVPPVSYDFEKHQTAKSLDEHVAEFGRRLKAKWQARPCFVDLRLISPSERMADETHPVERVFSLARKEGCHAIPVVALTSDDDYLRSAAEVKSKDKRGAALRIQLEDFDRDDLGHDVGDALAKVGVAFAEADLIVDLGDKQLLPINAFVRILTSALQGLPALNRWRTVTVCGTAYPATLAAIDGVKVIPRTEWTVYQALLKQLGDGIRIPTFGDYCVAHPDPVELDMRLIKPFAKLRYTTPEGWYIAKGKSVRTLGFEQYRRMCAAVTKEPFFDGAGFSEGDRYIADCAAGKAPTGNLTTWVWVSTNRHLSRVVADLDEFHGS